MAHRTRWMELRVFEFTHLRHVNRSGCVSNHECQAGQRAIHHFRPRKPLARFQYNYGVPNVVLQGISRLNTDQATVAVDYDATKAESRVGQVLLPEIAGKSTISASRIRPAFH